MAHGGAGRGQGRKKNSLSRVTPIKAALAHGKVEPIRRATAEEILGKQDEMAIWGQLLTDDDPKVRLDAIKYLTNRRDGMPLQAIGLT